jgi:hypothetical protein
LGRAEVGGVSVGGWAEERSRRAEGGAYLIVIFRKMLLGGLNGRIESTQGKTL